MLVGRRNSPHIDARQTWYAQFLRSVRQPDLAEVLREAALAARLADWTRALTHAVSATCDEMGWQVAAKGHPAGFMPPVYRQAQQEFLALDVMAFEDAASSPGEAAGWRFPVAVFELENSRRAERVAFSLWKVLMARAELRVVFCYSPDREAISSLVHTVAEAVLPGLPAAELAAAAPTLLLVVGTRDRAEGFPYGFFHEWVLDAQTGRFRRP